MHLIMLNKNYNFRRKLYIFKMFIIFTITFVNQNKEKFKIQIKNWINNFLNGIVKIDADIRFLSIKKNGI